MNENELRRRVADLAQSLRGRKEADGSHRAIIDIYNEIRPLPRGYKLTYTDAWCAGFVSAVAQALGLTAWVLPECSCPKMIALYKAAGRWVEDDAYLPQTSDLVFYDWQDSGSPADNQGQADHVGIVTEVSGDLITVTEGNCGHEVKDRALWRDGRYIRGYACPDYAAAAAALSIGEDPEDEPAAEAPADQAPDTITLPALPAGWNYVPLPNLELGNESEAVRALQFLLKGRGFSIGWMGADGEFGPRTESALGKYKIDRDLPRNAIAGPEVWHQLICE